MDRKLVQKEQGNPGMMTQCRRDSEMVRQEGSALSSEIFVIVHHLQVLSTKNKSILTF